MKYHIGIDGNEANVKNRVGSNQYAYGILRAIHEFHPQDTRFTIYLKAAALPDMPPQSSWWSYKVIGPSFAWTQWRLPLELYTTLSRPQVFFSPGHYAPRISPIPTVVSIMDLAFLKMPHLFLRFKRGAKQLVDWTEYSVKNAKAIIAISNNTKKDIIDAYQIKPDSIHVAYPGVDQSHYKPNDKKQVKAMREKYHLPEKYILHLGTLQPRKNIVRLIQAFEQLPDKFRTVHLVLAGQSGWLTEDIENAINHSKKKNLIIKTGFVEDSDIGAVMTGALCLCMVGLYEGFGMPPAESIACGTIPVISGNSSLPEVVGESGIVIDPYSVASIKHGIIAALTLTPINKAKRLELGKKHIAAFDWTKSARIILRVLYDLTIQR